MNNIESPEISYIALGSNLEQPELQLADAVTAIRTLQGVTLLRCSHWYANRAIGPGEQPDYLNGVLAIETTLSPLALLKQLQQIESQQGRVRQERWGARTLDLDMALYGNRISDDPVLTLPHPRLHERDFVVLPLQEIAPELILPNGTPISKIAEGFDTTALTPLKHVFCTQVDA